MNSLNSREKGHLQEKGNKAKEEYKIISKNWRNVDRKDKAENEMRLVRHPLPPALTQVSLCMLTTI